MVDEIVPDGDVLITLTARTEPIPDDDDTVDDGCNTTRPEEIGDEQLQHDTDAQPIRQIFQYKVSGERMSAACPRFAIMLNGPWVESKIHADGLKHVDMEGFDGRAFRIVLCVIHGREGRIPSAEVLTVDMLADIAVVVDDLQCVEVFEPYAEDWVKIHVSALANQTGWYAWESGHIPMCPNMTGGPRSLLHPRELVMLVFVTRVFRLKGMFKTATNLALRNSTGRLPTLGLPVSERIINRIEEGRQQRITSVVRAARSLTRVLDDHICGSFNFPCRGICLSPMKDPVRRMLRARSLIDPTPVRPYVGCNVGDMMDGLDEVWTANFPRLGLTSRIHYGCIVALLLPYDRIRAALSPEGLDYDKEFPEVTESRR